ncbi:hypothetical protein MIR68_008475 [Amoeboaphelidium protococcarum]|nr:hypothetical protein MIR68_008475 [Amoeboaphelidium protococcarum]KAI3644341.1 hypothetical protein MP228_010505 [Amoeboaphelidium protococcarum]
MSRQWTHFLSIPLNYDSIVESHSKLVTQMRSLGVPDNAILPWNRLHLTLAMFDLQDADKLERCKRVLREFQLPADIRIKLQGIHIMKGTMKSAKVVYMDAKCCDQSLELMLRDLLTRYMREGLATRFAFEELKLHMTLINVKYADNRPFDATELMTLHKDFELGEVSINRLQISKMARNECSLMDKDGYYAYELRIQS